MKNTNTMKQIVSSAKAKSNAIKSKADGVRTRLSLLSFMFTGTDHKKKLNFSLGFGLIAEKIQSVLHLIRRQHGKKGEDGDQLNQEETAVEEVSENMLYIEDNYPDLRHSLFDEQEEEDDELYLGDPNGSVIDLVRDSKEEGEGFSLENEIDHVADLFILKFHKNMRLQKLESFKRYQQLLERSV